MDFDGHPVFDGFRGGQSASEKDCVLKIRRLEAWTMDTKMNIDLASYVETLRSTDRLT
jgi:hypothetical protein